MKKERFFGKNGQTAFLGAAVLVLLICYIDNFHGGSAWIPTYFQHVAVNCLIAAILALGLNFVSGYLGQTSLGHAAFYGIGAYTTAVLLNIPTSVSGSPFLWDFFWQLLYLFHWQWLPFV